MDDKEKRQNFVDLILSEHEAKENRSMGLLHNRLVGFISESKLEISKVITVLQILLNEAVQMANNKYLGGE